MNPKDFQLTELLYDRRSILLRAIQASYTVYCQLNTAEPLRGDLAEATRRLVSSLLWVQFMKGEDPDGMMGLLYQYIKVACLGKGEGYSRRFDAELWLWYNDVSNEFTKFQNNATNQSPSNQEGTEQV